jgi:hypothetical protein
VSLASHGDVLLVDGLIIIAVDPSGYAPRLEWSPWGSGFTVLNHRTDDNARNVLGVSRHTVADATNGTRLPVTVSVAATDGRQASVNVTVTVLRPLETPICTAPQYTIRDPLNVFLYGSVVMHSHLATSWVHDFPNITLRTIASVANTLPPWGSHAARDSWRQVLEEDVHIVRVLAEGPNNRTSIEYVAWLQLDKALVYATGGAPPMWLQAHAMRTFAHRLDAALHYVLPPGCIHYGDTGLACEGAPTTGNGTQVAHSDLEETASCDATGGSGDSGDSVSWAGIVRSRPTLDGSPFAPRLEVPSTARSSGVTHIQLPNDWLDRASRLV